MRNIDLVMYISISNVFVQTCCSNATTAKIWNLRDFFQHDFFSVPKIENSRPDALAGLTN